MRILRLLFGFLVWLAIAAAAVYFVGARVWLAIGGSMFIRDSEVLVKQLAQEEKFAARCQQAPTASQLSRPKALQLRFENDRDFSVELVCTFIESAPIKLYESSLPLLLTKARGSSGFYYDLTYREPTSLRLELIAVHQDFTFNGEKTVRANLAVAPPAVARPASVCKAFGYTCCTPDVEKGTGEMITDGVTDCPANCASSCAAVPYVQSFTADPYPETSNEVILSSPEQSVVFSYVTAHAGGRIVEVSIDYGDGQVETSDRDTGIFTHTYRCDSACRYPVTLRAKDSLGNISATNSTSTLFVVRR